MKTALASVLVGAFVLGTGAAGLIYQVVLVRYVSRIVGSDHLAIGLTLATFLAGLALGYRLCGRWTLRVTDHLRAYGLLEGSIGLWGLAFPSIFGAVQWAVSSWSFAQPWGLLIQGLAVSSVLVLPPTLAMGATVPFLTRALSALVGQTSRVHAAVYAINTAGAFFGALAAGFVLIPAYGLPGTVRIAAGINLAALVFFVVLARARRRSGADLEPVVVMRREPEGAARFPAGLLYLVAFLNGLAVLTLETSLLRFGALVLGGSSYTFALIVAIFVLSLALGSLAVALARALPVRTLFVVQLAAGLYLLLLYFSLDAWPYFLHLVRIGFQAGPVGFWFYHAALLSALLAILVVPVALLGATLPAIFHELRASVGESGDVSGRLLAWNGLGTLLGSLAGGFVLYYFLDTPRIYLLVPTIAFASAALVARPLVRTARVAAVMLLVAASLGVWVRPSYDESRLAVGLYRTRHALPFSYAGPDIFFSEYGKPIRFFADDPVATVAVIDGGPADSEGPSGLALTVNGKSESDTLRDAETLRLLAHLPALWSPSRERTLIVGLGTGVTAGQLALYPDVREIDVAEISPAIVHSLPLFGEFTHDVHADPRLQIHARDALLVLRRGDAPWNLIVSEPSNPWVTRADQLFTVDFYRLVRSRLAEDGLFVQWWQLYESDLEMLGIVLNSLKEVFPVVHAFRGTEGDLLLLAAGRALTTEDRQRAEAVFAGSPRVRDALAEIGIAAIADLLAREVSTLPTLEERSRTYGISTLDRPRLHYLAGRAMFSGTRVTDEMLRGTTDLDFLFSDEFQRLKGVSRPAEAR